MREYTGTLACGITLVHRVLRVLCLHCEDTCLPVEESTRNVFPVDIRMPIEEGCIRICTCIQPRRITLISFATSSGKPKQMHTYPWRCVAHASLVKTPICVGRTTTSCTSNGMVCFVFVSEHTADVNAPCVFVSLLPRFCLTFYRQAKPLMTALHTLSSEQADQCTDQTGISLEVCCAAWGPCSSMRSVCAYVVRLMCLSPCCYLCVSLCEVYVANFDLQEPHEGKYDRGRVHCYGLQSIYKYKLQCMFCI